MPTIVVLIPSNDKIGDALQLRYCIEANRWYVSQHVWKINFPYWKFQNRPNTLAHTYAMHTHRGIPQQYTCILLFEKYHFIILTFPNASYWFIAIFCIFLNSQVPVCACVWMGGWMCIVYACFGFVYLFTHVLPYTYTYHPVIYLCFNIWTTLFFLICCK